MERPTVFQAKTMQPHSAIGWEDVAGTQGLATQWVWEILSQE